MVEDIKKMTFSYREVAEALVRAHGIHEGLWGIYMEFGIGAANIGTDPAIKNLVPAAIVPVVKVGIQRFGEENPLTVDAAKVNPFPGKGRHAKKEDLTSRPRKKTGKG